MVNGLGLAVGLLALNDDWFLVVSLMRIDVITLRFCSGWACTFSYRSRSLRHLDCLLQGKSFVDSCHFVRGFCNRGSTFHVLPRAETSGRNILAQTFCNVWFSVLCPYNSCSLKQSISTLPRVTGCVWTKLGSARHEHIPWYVRRPLQY